MSEFMVIGLSVIKLTVTRTCFFCEQDFETEFPNADLCSDCEQGMRESAQRALEAYEQSIIATGM